MKKNACFLQHKSILTSFFCIAPKKALQLESDRCVGSRGVSCRPDSVDAKKQSGRIWSESPPKGRLVREFSCNSGAFVEDVGWLVKFLFQIFFRSYAFKMSCLLFFLGPALSDLFCKSVTRCASGLPIRMNEILDYFSPKLYIDTQNGQFERRYIHFPNHHSGHLC